MGENRVRELLPPNYVLVATYFPNLELISTMEVFRRLPFTMWFIMNNGIVKKGYWMRAYLRYARTS